MCKNFHGKLKSQLFVTSSSENQVTSKGDRGAVSVIFGVLLSGFLVIGLLALVIDVGVLYQERRTLQNAADATALAIAQECAELQAGSAATLCQSTFLDKASEFAGKNSDDRKTEVFEVCGIGVGSAVNLMPCPPSSTKQFDCKDSSISGVEQFVRVRTKTLSSDGQPFMRYFFAPFLENAADNVSMRACAQVTWGAATEAPVIFQLALPICGYKDRDLKQHNQYKASAKFYVTPEECSYTPIGSSSTFQINVGSTQIIKGAVIFTKVNLNLTGCSSIFNPIIVKIDDLLAPVPDGSGDEIVNLCLDFVRSLGYNQSNKNDAYTAYLSDFVLGKTLYIPVVSDYKSSDGTSVRVTGFFSVIVRGIKIKNVVEVGYGESGPKFPSSNAGWITGDCNSTEYCIYGQFTRSTPPGRPKPNNPNKPKNTGVNTVVLLP